MSLVPLEMVLATNSAMLGADLSTTENEDELTRNKGHQGHGGLEERIRQTMRIEGITFAEAIRRPRNLIVGTPATIADYMQDLSERLKGEIRCELRISCSRNTATSTMDFEARNFGLDAILQRYVTPITRVAMYAPAAR